MRYNTIQVYNEEFFWHTISNGEPIQVYNEDLYWHAIPETHPIFNYRLLFDIYDILYDPNSLDKKIEPWIVKELFKIENP